MDETRWILTCFLALVVIPLAIGLSYYLYRTNLTNSWIENPSPYIFEIQSIVNSTPGYFTKQDRESVENFTVTETITKAVSLLERDKIQLQFGTTIIIVIVIFYLLLIYTARICKFGEEKIAVKKYDTDVDLAQWLMNLGGAGGSSISVATGILLSSTSISLFVVVALPVFAMIIIFGLSARSLMSFSIKSEDDKSITLVSKGYDAFWDNIRLQYFLLFLGISLLSLGILTSSIIVPYL